MKRILIVGATLGALGVVALVATTGYVGAGDRVEQAVAVMQDGPLAGNVSGTVTFRQAGDGVWVSVNVSGLPAYQSGTPPIGPHGFHIHAVGNCTVGDAADPFLAAGGHFNPTSQPHGDHAGDMPVLFSNGGAARMTVFTDAFEVGDVNGKAVIIHQNPDDYRTQPTGAAGKRLACGVIESKRAND